VVSQFFWAVDAVVRGHGHVPAILDVAQAHLEGGSLTPIQSEWRPTCWQEAAVLVITDSPPAVEVGSGLCIQHVAKELDDLVVTLNVVRHRGEELPIFGGNAPDDGGATTLQPEH
jgi:hypothetical protein